MVTPLVAGEEMRDPKDPLQKASSHDEELPSRQALISSLQVQKPSPWSPGLRKLYGFCLIAFLCSTMNGLYPFLRAVRKERYEEVC